MGFFTVTLGIPRRMSDPSNPFGITKSSVSSENPPLGEHSSTNHLGYGCVGRNSPEYTTKQTRSKTHGPKHKTKAHVSREDRPAGQDGDVGSKHLTRLISRPCIRPNFYFAGGGKAILHTYLTAD